MKGDQLGRRGIGVVLRDVILGEEGADEDGKEFHKRKSSKFKTCKKKIFQFSICHPP